MPLIEIEHIGKSYPVGDGDSFAALKDVSLFIEEGEFVAIMGPSGSGKSTFMNLLGALDTPSSGAYRLNGTDVSGLDDADLAHLRNQTIGFVFQSFNLIPRRSVLDNVCMPLLYAGMPRAERHEKGMEYLQRVGLADLTERLPTQLSGGQQQRVAIARALVSEPKLILADEPTGNLDSHTADGIMALFADINAAGMTIILVTHEQKVADHAKRIIRFKDGRLL